MKRRLTVFFLTMIITLTWMDSRADEGMWLLPLLEEINIRDMQELGFELTAEDVYSINNSSLKDAIVIFGPGCTGEIVSDQGLLFTNHHCGYDEIQNHSTVDHDYLRDGFWAYSREEELSNPDLEVRFLKRIEIITDQILRELSDQMNEEDRRSKIRELSKEITGEAEEDGKYEALVKSFFEGNKYYLFVYEVYKDVRLVGAPPSSIGKFGYDTDNWEWPRHTGDFSIFRVYTAPDGSPAEYAPENIPLKPDYYLPISLGGVEKGDFTMILGFPGRTHRYLSSYGIEETMTNINDVRVLVRGARQEILLEDMLADDAVRINYATKYSRSSNYWKYSIGQNKGLRDLDILSKKRKEEEKFMQWAREDSARNVKYGNILRRMEEIYDKRESDDYNFQLIEEAFFRATELINYITDFHYLYVLLLTGEEKAEDIDEEIQKLRKLTDDFFQEYHLPTDKKVAKAMFKLYYDHSKVNQRPDIYSIIGKKYKGNFDKFVDKLFLKTFFTDKDKVLAFLQNPKTDVLIKDPGFIAGNSIVRKYFEEYGILDNYDLELDKLKRLYIKGRMEMNPGVNFYPDANFTMRLTYGTVDDYSPRDAVHFDYYTRLKGVLEKEDSTDYEFVVPKKLKGLYNTKDFGRYGAEDMMPVCFITNNDITGGNSGSPVLNAKGELIGLAFDGNWEAMSSDIAYEPGLQRCICVDIRYVLFIIEKFAGDMRIIEELEILN
jgi:hypothetical protein